MIDPLRFISANFNAEYKLGIRPRVDLIIDAFTDAITEGNKPKITYYSNLLGVLKSKPYPGEPVWVTALVMSMKLGGTGTSALCGGGSTSGGDQSPGSVSNPKDNSQVNHTAKLEGEKSKEGTPENEGRLYLTPYTPHMPTLSLQNNLHPSQQSDLGLSSL